MVLARPESPLFRRCNEYSSSPLVDSRYSISPTSIRDSSPLTDNRVATPISDTPPPAETTGWINNSPQKKLSPHFEREDTPLSSESVTSPVSSGRKPHKLKRRRSSKITPPLFSWRAKSKSPPVAELPPTPSPSVTNHHEDHYHLYDVGTRVTPITPHDPRQSIASLNSISGRAPRTPLKRIYPPPQVKDSPRLISPNSLCQVQSCNNGTPSREQLLIKTLRRMTSDGQLSPTRSVGHRRNQSVPSFDNALPATPDRKPNGFAYETPLRPGDPTVWLVSGCDASQEDDEFASRARRRLEFGSQHSRKTSSSSSYAQRMSSQSPPSTIPERYESLNWDSESDPTYESMKMEQDERLRKVRVSTLFDDTDIEKVIIPEHKSPRTVVTILPHKSSDDELDLGDRLSLSNGHPNIRRRLPSWDVQNLHIPSRTTSLSRSKSVPPVRPEMSPEKYPKRLSGICLYIKTELTLVAPKECWDNDFEDEGSDMWMIPENISEAQDKLKGYLLNIRTFSTVIEDLKRFRQLHPRTHRRPASQEQLLDEIDAMIEISTLDGFTPPPFSGPLPSPKKSNTSLASSQWSFEDKFKCFGIDDERALPTPPPVLDSDEVGRKDLHARQLLEKILGASDDVRMEVKPEQLSKMIDYVVELKSKCNEFESLDGINGSWNIGLGVYM